jgi:aminopeptidase N
MDEGFTSYASSLATASIFGRVGNPHLGSFAGYVRLAKSGLEEPLATHADHFNTNAAYGAAAYSKGAVFLEQLGYVIGAETRDRGMLKYFDTWKFKHPNVNDLIRIMEKESGLELDWYKEYFVQTTKTIDYGIQSVEAKDGKTELTLERKGLMPMPLDVVITYQDGTSELIYLPLVIMRGGKEIEKGLPKRAITEAWPWTNPTKMITLQVAKSAIKSIEIDPSLRMADVERANNKIDF